MFDVVCVTAGLKTKAKRKENEIKRRFKEKEKALPTTLLKTACLVYTKEPFIQVTNRPKPKVTDIITTNTN